MLFLQVDKINYKSIRTYFSHQSQEVYLFSQHNSLCSEAPIFPKIMLANF